MEEAAVYVYIDLLYVQVDSNDCPQTWTHIVGIKGIIPKAFALQKYEVLLNGIYKFSLVLWQKLLFVQSVPHFLHNDWMG